MQPEEVGLMLGERMETRAVLLKRSTVDCGCKWAGDGLGSFVRPRGGHTEILPSRHHAIIMHIKCIISLHESVDLPGLPDLLCHACIP